MAPSSTNSCISSQLRQLIYYHIDNNLLQNALFLAERLAAFDHRNADSSYLLSLCHLRLGDHKSAYEYSKVHGWKGSHVGCAYIYAQAALALERWKDGINALEKSRGLWAMRNNFAKHNNFSRQPYPDAAAVYCLLGKLYQAYDNKKQAISYFEESLKLNPFMWDAFTNLCDMGASVRVPNIFKVSPEMEAVLKSQPDSTSSFGAKDMPSYIPNQSDRSRNIPSQPDPVDPFNNAPSKGFNGGLFGSLGLSSKLNESSLNMTNIPAVGGGGIGPEAIETPTGPSAAIDVNVAHNVREPGVVSAYSVEHSQVGIRKNRTLQGIGIDRGLEAPKMNRAISTKQRSLRDNPSLDNVLETTTTRPSEIPPAGGERKRTISGQVVQPRQTSEDPGAPQRRSVRLFNQIRPTTKPSSNSASSAGTIYGRELKKARPPISRIMRPGSSTSTVGRVVSGNRKPLDDGMDLDAREFKPHPLQNYSNVAGPAKPYESETAKQEEALRRLLDLFRKLGQGYFALSQFQCQEAIHMYSSLERSQMETPWVLAQMGRAHYEQAAYADAEKYYKRIRSLAPTRFEEMEVYSTILWHLKKETDLSFLAHELIDADWHSPQAWCALGNAWSLARDHEQALKCFKRATQLDPKFAYAFTLQGHEHVSNEEYDKALSAYRHGMSADKRHYNAYYGVGRVYEKLGNYEKAFIHFTAASAINPTNAVLICCIGTVLEKQKDYRHALKYFTKATELAPRSALTRFKKARALMALGEMEVALAELMVLKDLAPDEAMVHFLLGRLYKSMHEKGLAVRHFTIALNLDPKVNLSSKVLRLKIVLIQTRIGKSTNQASY
jgi:anaphase-promoting complex subunit 3